MMRIVAVLALFVIGLAAGCVGRGTAATNKKNNQTTGAGSQTTGGGAPINRLLQRRNALTN